MRTVGLISGKDSATACALYREQHPDEPITYLYNATGAELPEVEAWLTKMEGVLGAPIERVGADLWEIIHEEGILPSSRVRYCTRKSKIYPMETALAGEPTQVIFGLRADEARIGYQPGPKSQITPLYPLIDAGYTIDDVWDYLSERDLLPPLFFWQEVYDRTVAALGDYAAVLDDLPKPLFYSLFGWRSRPNCYFCFFQRQYEFIGLLEYHPDLFWKTVELEEGVGAEGYTLQPSYSVRSLVARREEILEKRVKAIITFLFRMAQTSLLEPQRDDLSMTSCGLLCGK